MNNLSNQNHVSSNRQFRAVRAGLPALLALLGVACAATSVDEDASEISSENLQNGAKNFVPTSFSMYPGNAVSGSFTSTHLADGVGHHVVETMNNGVMALWADWTLSSVPSGNYTLRIVARRTSSSGDNFEFRWAPSAGSASTSVCTLGSGDTAFRTCSVPVTLYNTQVIVKLGASIHVKDTTANGVVVDSIELIPAVLPPPPPPLPGTSLSGCYPAGTVVMALRPTTSFSSYYADRTVAQTFVAGQTTKLTTGYSGGPVGQSCVIGTTGFYPVNNGSRSDTFIIGADFKLYDPATDNRCTGSGATCLDKCALSRCTDNVMVSINCCREAGFSCKKGTYGGICSQ